MNISTAEDLMRRVARLERIVGDLIAVPYKRDGEIQERKRYKEGSRSRISAFIADNCVIDSESAGILSMEFLEKYKGAIGRDIHPREMAADLREVGIKIKYKNVNGGTRRVVIGLAWKSEEEMPFK